MFKRVNLSEIAEIVLREENKLVAMVADFIVKQQDKDKRNTKCQVVDLCCEKFPFFAVELFAVFTLGIIPSKYFFYD